MLAVEPKIASLPIGVAGRNIHGFVPRLCFLSDRRDLQQRQGRQNQRDGPVEKCFGHAYWSALTLTEGEALAFASCSGPPTCGPQTSTRWQSKPSSLHPEWSTLEARRRRWHRAMPRSPAVGPAASKSR